MSWVIEMVGTDLNAFYDSRYRELEKIFLERSAKSFGKNFDSIAEKVLDGCKKSLIAAKKIQAEEKISCGFMSLSFLNSSLIENSPTIQIDFYNHDWVYGESFSRTKLDADFLLAEWESFCAEALDEKFFHRARLNPAEIKSLFWDTAEKNFYLFTCFGKYFLPELEFSTEYQELDKEENFYLTCGMYLDWQERIFAELPEIDLFNLDANEETQLRKFEGKIFRDKVFADLDLTKCRFSNCLFDRCKFSSLRLVDARFRDCRLYHSDFEEISAAGCLFQNCKFRDTNFSGCNDEPDGSDEYFFEVQFENCNLTREEFLNGTK